MNFLRTALGSAAIPEPAINLSTSFTTLAVAAGLITAGQTFNPFASELDFLLGAYIFEDVGVTAYAGAAALLTDPDNIAYGASILAIEAEHAGCIRGYLASIGGGAATDSISALRQSLSGVQDNGTNLSASGGNPFSFANDDYNGQVFRRTPQQVLNIVYGTSGTGVTSGLFFPNGVNSPQERRSPSVPRPRRGGAGRIGDRRLRHRFVIEARTRPSPHGRRYL